MRVTHSFNYPAAMALPATSGPRQGSAPRQGKVLNAMAGSPDAVRIPHI